MARRSDYDSPWKNRIAMTRENQIVEFKETWKDDYLRWICGFANAQGGVLIIGTNDRGEHVGVNSAEKLLEDLPNKIRDLLGIIVEVNLELKKDKELLEIHVPAYTNPISYRGRYYMRSGTTLQELKGVALDRFLLQRQGRTWDSVPMPGVKIDDLSRSDIQKFREMATTSGRLTEADLSANGLELLAKLKLTEGSYLKRSAILLFHQDPDRLITGAYVKIGFFTSEAELAYHDEIHGSLFYQAHTVFDLIHTKYMKAAISYKGIQRIEIFPVPYEALREVILNALVHRDYAVPAPIQIRVYEDKLKIWNPAILPDNWTVETLLGAHASQPYNPDVANAFFRSGEIESWGRGIDRIVSACRNADSPPPEIKLQGHDLWFEFPYSDNYLSIMRKVSENNRPAQVKNMRNSQNGLVDRLADRLVENQQNILKMVKTNPRISKKQMAKIIGISTTAIDKNIEKLKKLGLIKRVGSPKSGHWEVTQ